MVTEPSFSPVTTPFSSTVAMFSSELDQVKVSFLYVPEAARASLPLFSSVGSITTDLVPDPSAASTLTPLTFTVNVAELDLSRIQLATITAFPVFFGVILRVSPRHPLLAVTSATSGSEDFTFNSEAE